MSISIEIEKDLKMHVFLAKTKNAHLFFANKGNNKITELRTILQRESPNS
jgi:hypothetical protein